MRNFSPETFDPSMHGWVGFDLDGTLAKDEPGAAWSHTDIGEPISEMVELVKAYLAKGAEVRILTARAGEYQASKAVERWAKQVFGQHIEVTDKKDYAMWCLYDDRAVTVERNTGRILTMDAQTQDVVREAYNAGFSVGTKLEKMKNGEA